MLNTPDVTHFAMIHADIAADPYWIDTLIQETEKNDLDVLSVVMPIKDESGDTSTGILQENGIVHRLSLSDIAYYELPKTFTLADIQLRSPLNGKLLVNTGLWVCKVGDWCKTFDGFRANSQIIKKDDGTYDTINSPEDWDSSVVFEEMGLKIGATTAVKARHYGTKAWPNY